MNKKFELTSETKVRFGRILYRVRALLAFGKVKIGELGGWVEKESNCSKSGNAWVFGNAEVFGDAEVFGNARVFGDAEKTPIFISGLYWAVTITDHHIKIGCEFYKTSEWASFDNDRINKMDSSAVNFWDEHKNTILFLANFHQQTQGED